MIHEFFKWTFKTTKLLTFFIFKIKIFKSNNIFFNYPLNKIFKIEIRMTSVKQNIPKKLLKEAKKYENQDRVHIIRRRKTENSEKFTSTTEENFRLNEKPISKRVQTPSPKTQEFLLNNNFNTRGPNKKFLGNVLLLLPTDDEVGDTLSLAVGKLGFLPLICSSFDEALDRFDNLEFPLVCVDTRFSTLVDCEDFCRNIKFKMKNQPIVAIVKKFDYEDNCDVVSILLDAGYTRCVVCNTKVITWINELKQLMHFELKKLNGGAENFQRNAFTQY